ncbi:MAG: hypothetical protein FWG68_04860, partial [Defluviitaleaceae bacterium]|nr:hypothetical protein [Defluviitaleaceae bacterium]
GAGSESGGESDGGAGSESGGESDGGAGSESGGGTDGGAGTESGGESDNDTEKENLSTPLTPTSISISASTVTWEGDAPFHNIYVDNEPVEIAYSNSSYDLSNLDLDPGVHEVQVSAFDDTGQESEPSPGVSYVVWHFS